MTGNATVFVRARSVEAPILAAPSLPRVISAAGIGRVELIGDMASAEPHWRRLEETGVLTPYQRFDWVAGWQRHVGAAQNVSPLLLTAFDKAGEPLFIWPLGSETKPHIKVARFLGGKHANYNFGPWRRDFTCDSVVLRALIDWIAEVRPDLDTIELTNQPETWEGMKNPFLMLAHQRSPSDGFKLSLTGNADEQLSRMLSNSMRSRLRNKERKLEKIAGYRYVRATTESEVERYLGEFLKQKAPRLAAQGIENIFASSETVDFMQEACLRDLGEGKPVIEIHALDSDGEMLAMFAGVNDGNRFSSMFNSYTLGDASRHSPGLVILTHIVRDCMARGLKTFDLGVGEAHYKNFFSDEPEPLFDSYFGLSPRGQALAAVCSAKAMVKRWVKRSPRLLQLALAVRRLKAGGKAPVESSGGEN
jgi:CelD/BcsL family acetyltransferase involved in cellulose biosynthesis